MSAKNVVQLDQEILDHFSRKGAESGGVQIANQNGVEVRRVVQLLQDLVGSSTEQKKIRVLDIACGEGVYSIETALRGVDVYALDARTERMGEGAEFAKKLGIRNLTFEQADARDITRESHGVFDLIYLLGILYHLDVPDVFHVLENIYRICGHFLIIDTHISLDPNEVILYEGRSYHGHKYREHEAGDTDEVKHKRLLSSIDNTFSFWFCKKSLIRLLVDTGFTAVMECHAPLTPGKRGDRITLVACKGESVQISTYPWVNSKSEHEIADALAASQNAVKATTAPEGAKQAVKGIVDALLRPLGYRLMRI